MSKMPQWLQNVFEVLIGNIFMLLTIGYAGYVIYRQQIARIAGTTEELLTATLTVLGLLAISELIERFRKLYSIQRANQRILSLLEGHTDVPSALSYLRPWPDIDSCVVAANHIDLCGAALTGTIHGQRHNLLECLRRGAEIRILITDPDSSAPKMSSARSGISPADYFRARLKDTWKDLQDIHNSWLELQQPRNAPRRGSLSIRCLPFAPSFKILSFDADRPNGIVFIELYPHYRYPVNEKPGFSLTPRRDGQWYKYFIDQFEEMWNGKDVTECFQLNSSEPATG